MCGFGGGEDLMVDRGERWVVDGWCGEGGFVWRLVGLGGWIMDF